ncbi:arginase family protein [Bacteroides thetaiotaomicron]|uniref:arginase family protein n=1 Tax=Bacteroides thetaiotaomicron TaxID=818 RepID=UPI001F1A96CD|nr:arginase family protein [Bacteroides thetaiotaomicron]MCE9161514.1 arginase family protein [Bacteroides thetaiotaomicron]
MKKLLLISLLCGMLFPCMAQKNIIKNKENQSMKTIRLIYPQWQGAKITHLIPELKDNPNDASKGYYLGAQLLNYLAPNTNQETFTVPVSMEMTDREITDGVTDRDVLLKQTKTALGMLNAISPDKIVTLGGECSVSVVPFTYLANKYKNDVAMIWIDAHPDITLPGDIYSGYHAMAVTACMGYGEKQIISTLPAKIEASKILFVGLRNWERDEIKVRQKQYGIKDIPGEEVTENSNAILNWLKSCGASKVVIHFDMDVLDPAEIVAAVGTDPNGMKIAQVIRVINDIAKEKELVGLTVAEAMPRTAIRIKSMLEQLPLLK